MLYLYTLATDEEYAKLVNGAECVLKQFEVSYEVKTHVDEYLNDAGFAMEETQNVLKYAPALLNPSTQEVVLGLGAIYFYCAKHYDKKANPDLEGCGQ